MSHVIIVLTRGDKILYNSFHWVRELLPRIIKVTGDKETKYYRPAEEAQTRGTPQTMANP